MAWVINTNKNSTPSTCSQEQEGEFSLTSYLDTIRLERARSNNTQEMSSSPDKETASSPISPSGMMFAPLTGSLGEEQLTLSLEDSPVKTSAQQDLITISTEKPLGSLEKNLGCGRKWLESLWKCHLPLRSLKIRQTLELKGLSQSCKTLTPWGITQDGLSLEVDISMPITTERECGYLPTPTCHNAKEGAYPAEYTRATPTLAAQIGGKVNPNWNESRMGWIIGWTDLKPLAMDKIAEWQQQHSMFLHED